MKELTPLQNLLFRLGALMMLTGVTINVFSHVLSLWLYAVGAMLFTLMQLRAEYLGRDVVVVRLRRQQMLSCVLFIVAAMLMSMQTYQYGFARRNEWVVALAIGCLLQVYTAWRIPAALSKAKKS